VTTAWLHRHCSGVAMAVSLLSIVWIGRHARKNVDVELAPLVHTWISRIDRWSSVSRRMGAAQCRGCSASWTARKRYGVPWWRVVGS
jgi:hypothetical protein